MHTRGLCNPTAWSHVTTSQRAGLRAAYAKSLADRIAQLVHPRDLELVL